MLQGQTPLFPRIFGHEAGGYEFDPLVHYFLCYFDKLILCWQWGMGETNLIFSFLVGLSKVLVRGWQTWNPVTMCFLSSQESARNADIANQRRVICVIFWGSTLTEVWCWMMESLDFQLEGSPFTTLLVPQPLVSTLWFMLAVLPRSIRLLLLTKFVSSAVEFQQVRGEIQFNLSSMDEEFVAFM